MRFSAALVAVAATAVSAQVANYTSSLNMTIDPNSVPQQQRAVWCQGQTNTCQVLCNTNTNKNDCNQATLSYSCTCASNNSAPGLQYYTQTMPTFICDQLFSNCIQANVGSAQAQAACTSNIKNLCGTVNPPTNDESSSSSTTSGSSPSATDSGSGSTTTAKPSGSASGSPTASGSAAAKSTTSSAFAAPTMVPIGTGAFAAAALGLMAYVL